jgi:aquaporin Z
VAPGALVMALIYAWGPLSGLHINPAVTLAFTGRGVFPPAWVLPYLVVQFAGAISASLFVQWMFGHIAAGGTYPIDSAGGDWRSFVMEILLTAILISVILHTATGSRSIGHNAALAVGATIAFLGLFNGVLQISGSLTSPISGASMNPARSTRRAVVAGSGHRGQRLHGLVGLRLRAADRSPDRRDDHRPVRGLPGKAERVAAEGGALPL